MRKAHYFIAVPLSNEVKERLAQWKMIVAPLFPFRSWVHMEDYHITLAFLGDVPFEQLKSVRQSMEQIVKKHAPFPLSLAELGTFGNSFAPRILWQGVEREEKLFALQRDVYEACVDIGFSLDRRPFKPHITVARKWQGEHEFRLEEMRQIEEMKGSFLVDHVILYQTHLDRVPKYEAVAVFPLSFQKGERAE